MANGMQETWERSFQDQIAQAAYNAAPVEALVRTVSHYLRARYAPALYRDLHFLEVGCGAGPNLVWLTQRGILASGVDIAPTALELARRNLAAAAPPDRIGRLEQASASALPFPDAHFDGVLEACVFQHLPKADRIAAFAEVGRVLRPGGIFAGYMLGIGHSTFAAKGHTELADDPGTVMLDDSADGSKVHLESIGLAHFFRREEFAGLLPGFSVVDPCETTYELPREEAARRGVQRYLQNMWVVFAVK